MNREVQIRGGIESKLKIGGVEGWEVKRGCRVARSYGTSRRSIPNIPAERLTQTLFTHLKPANFSFYTFSISTAAMQQKSLSSIYCFFFFQT